MSEKPSKKDLLAEIAVLEQERDASLLELADAMTKWETRLEDAEKEYRKLDRQLASIREAFQSLHEVVHPNLYRMKSFIPSIVGAFGALPPGPWNGSE